MVRTGRNLTDHWNNIVPTALPWKGYPPGQSSKPWIRKPQEVNTRTQNPAQKFTVPYFGSTATSTHYISDFASEGYFCVYGVPSQTFFSIVLYDFLYWDFLEKKSKRLHQPAPQGFLINPNKSL